MTRRKIFLCIVGFLLLVVIAAIAWVNHRINGSLPILDGEIAFTGLTNDVTVERDDAGMPTITAKTRADAAFALGFLHGQDRFFQMDLLRRSAAGRLAELFGAGATEFDKSVRLHRFDELAKTVIGQCDPIHLELIHAYSDGVNSGLGALQTSPFEYQLLRLTPEEWKPTDSVLVSVAMACTLQDPEGRLDYLHGKVYESTPPQVFDFLLRRGTEWDAAMDGTTFTQPMIPPADVWTIEGVGGTPSNTDKPTGQPVGGQPVPGSNNWAVGGALTADGRAIMASDMHLSLSVPAIWYRAAIKTPATGTDREVRLVGVTLPGTPALVAGSNGSVAWGFTNSMGDYGDIIELQTPDDDDTKYLTADGRKEFETFTHTISVKDEPSQTFESTWTQWGPVTIVEPPIDGATDKTPAQNPKRRRFVHHWVSHDPNAVNFNLLNLEAVTSAEEAVTVANSCGMAQNNFVCAADSGDIGWTIAGRIPNRFRPPHRLPVSSTEYIGWFDYLPSKNCPRLLSPESHRIWTANGRVAGGKSLEILGGDYALGARARQVRDRLFEKNRFNERDMLAIQLDDEAILMQRWHQLLVEVIDLPETELSDAFETYIKQWDGYASVESVAYRILQAFRRSVIDDLDASLLPAAEGGHGPLVWGLQHEGFVWQLITEQPEHLLPWGESWNEYLAVHATEVESALTINQELASATWGQANTVTVQHPFSQVMPSLSNWLDMPTVQLPGDANLPRVQAPGFGASNRFVVAPGHEEDAIMHLPGGQSGHPRSPFYRKGFDDWVQGNPTPMLPGDTKYRLMLKAEGED